MGPVAQSLCCIRHANLSMYWPAMRQPLWQMVCTRTFRCAAKTADMQAGRHNNIKQASNGLRIMQACAPMYTAQPQAVSHTTERAQIVVNWLAQLLITIVASPVCGQKSKKGAGQEGLRTHTVYLSCSAGHRLTTSSQLQTLVACTPHQAAGSCCKS